MFDDILHKGFEEYQRYVNPMIAQRATLAGEPVELMRVVDGVPVDRSGQPIEDMHGAQTLGHRNAAAGEALRDFLSSDRLSWYPSRVNPFAGRLARRLYERTGYDSTSLACSGSEAVESSLKLARARTRRPRILGIQGAYHGCTYGSCALMAPGPFRDPFGPHLPGVESIPFGDVDALRAALAPGDVAAVIAEPVQIEGGVRPLTDRYVEALCTLTEQHGTLLVADEVQTGLGRGGTGFLVSSEWPRRPDAVLLAKALGGGLVPISAMLTDRETFMAAYGRDFASGEAHNTTFANSALGCVAALATLDLLTDEVIADAGARGGRLLDGLVSKIGDSPRVADVRGRGMMLGIELAPIDHPWLTFEHLGLEALADRPISAPLMCHRLYKHGFYCFTAGHDWSVIRLQPRLDIPDETIDAFVDAVAQEVAWLQEQM